VEITHDHEVLGMFLAADTIAVEIAAKMRWVGMRAPIGSAFILSDHPLAFCDDNARPLEPVTWLSSPTVEVTLPLDTTFCLGLTPGEPLYHEAEVTADQVMRSIYTLMLGDIGRSMALRKRFSSKSGQPQSAISGESACLGPAPRDCS